MQTDIQRIGELSSDGVFVYDYRTEVFTYINDSFARIFSLTTEKIMKDPRALLTLIRTEDNEYLHVKYDELLKNRTLRNTEFRMHLAEDVLRHLSIDAYLIQETFLIIGFLKDSTTEKEHENYIINFGAKKDTLLDMLTHNLSGPLHLTQNVLRWMQTTYKDKAPGDISSQLQIIENNTQECLDIVNDFLKEEHLASEKISVRKTRFDLLERIVETLDKLIATNKNKTFKLVSNLDSLNISTDAVKFFQVIHNLISNAIKFTADQGEIDIIVDETENTFIIKIKDNGIGIPQKLQPDLFLKRTPSGRNGLNNEFSTGMGLSIVKKLTELMGGNVKMESVEDKGSVFTVELPKE